MFFISTDGKQFTIKNSDIPSYSWTVTTFDFATKLVDFLNEHIVIQELKSKLDC